MFKMKFADIGEGLHEGKVTKIYVKVGDKVKEGDNLFEVETSKMTSEITSIVNGTVTEILMKEDEEIHVGDHIFTIDDGSKDVKETVVEKKEEAGASVVGEVKTSNELLSFNFAKKAAPVAVTKSTTPTKETSNKFNINNFEASGDGEKYDVVVIGAGPGGYTAAEFLAKSGLKTLVIEKEKAGGVCLNVGCIPTKTLLKSAKIFEYIKNAGKYGIKLDVSNVSLDWNAMQKRKNDVSTQLAKGVESLIKMAKATLVYGEANILDKHNLMVGDKKYTFKILVLATGSTNIVIPTDGFKKGLKDGKIIDSTGALSLSEVPKSLVVIGGGVIGSEFAALYNELGTKVTILEGGDSILGPMDEDVKKYIMNKFTSEGIEIITKTKVLDYDGTNLLYELDGKTNKIKADKILLSIGRRANNLGLDKTLGLALGPRGEIIVDDKMQTNIDNIFAIGDVTNKAMLAHVAYKQAHVLVNYIKGIHEGIDLHKVPGCVYTHPEISVIGRTEAQVKAEGIDYIKVIWQNKNVGKILADGNENDGGFTKLLVGKKYGEILGAHIINNTSSDMIAEIATLMELEGTVYELASTIHPHPSISEIIYEAAQQAVEKLEKNS